MKQNLWQVEGKGGRYLAEKWDCLGAGMEYLGVMGRVNHPSVVNVVDSFCSDG